MFKTIFAAVVAVGALATGSTVASAQTVDVLVMQSDADPNSLERGTQVQRGMLIEFQKVLNSPDIASHMRQYGIEGMDVIDETAAIIQAPNYDTTRTRRSDEELLTLVRQLPNQSIDAVILYTIYARAVPDPYTGISLLQASLQYRVYGRDGRFLGGDNMALDTNGIPFTGCAAAVNGQRPDELCVRQLVTEHIGRLGADAANKIALQLAALIGSHYGSPSSGAPSGGYNEPIAGAPSTGRSYAPSISNACANLPTVYVLTFNGVSGRQKNAIEEFMASWDCATNLELESDSLSSATYRYKTSADRGRIVRNIRQMFEAMGVFVDPRTQGEREIIVETVNLRSN